MLLKTFYKNATDGCGYCDSDIRMIEEGVQHLESPCVGVGPWGSLDIYSPITVAASGLLSLSLPLSTALLWSLALIPALFSPTEMSKSSAQKSPPQTNAE